MFTVFFRSPPVFFFWVRLSAFERHKFIYIYTGRIDFVKSTNGKLNYIWKNVKTRVAFFGKSEKSISKLITHAGSNIPKSIPYPLKPKHPSERGKHAQYVKIERCMPHILKFRSNLDFPLTAGKLVCFTAFYFLNEYSYDPSLNLL